MALTDVTCSTCHREVQIDVPKGHQGPLRWECPGDGFHPETGEEQPAHANVLDTGGDPAKAHNAADAEHGLLFAQAPELPAGVESIVEPDAGKASSTST